MSVYDPLRDCLRRSTLGDFEMTFAEVERITGRPLPDSAKRPQWWENSAGTGHTQREAWRAAGYDAFLIKDAKRVRFSRVGR